MAYSAISSRPILAFAAAVVLLHLTFTVDSTEAQTTAAATNAPTTVLPSTAAPAANKTHIRFEVVLVHEGIAVWASFLLVVILIADACKNYTVVKYTAIVGPVGCMILAGVVLLLACLPAYNNGNNQQGGFQTVIIQASIVAAVAFIASFSAFWYRKNIDAGLYKPNMAGGAMGWLIGAGMTTAIGGTIVAALDVEEGYQWPGMILGSFLCGKLMVLMIWNIVYENVTVKKHGCGAKVGEESDGMRMDKA